MNIKPGKWRMRNGECAVVEYKTGAETKYPWRGYVISSQRADSWTEAGVNDEGEDSAEDLIEPWTDKPVVNWPAMPAWAKWVAMEQSGVWIWFKDKPELMECEGWWLAKVTGRGCNGGLPEEFAPSFSGNWRDSLVERPAE